MAETRDVCYRQFCAELNLRMESFGMTKSIRDTGMEALPGRKAPSGVSLEWRRLLSPWTCSIILRWSDFTTTDAPRSPAYQSLLERSGIAESVKTSSMPLAWPDACKQRKIWTINADLRDWCGGRAAGWQMACRSIWPNQRLFGSWRYDDWDCRKAAIDIVPLWLTEILKMRTIFSGIENLNGDGLALPPPSSINRLDSLCRSSLCHFL